MITPPVNSSFWAAKAVQSATAQPQLPVVAKKEALLQIVTPQARDRWNFTTTRNYTPTSVGNVLASAFGGNLDAQWELFNLMEETWPRLLGNLSELKRSVKGLDWIVTPWTAKGKKPSANAQKRADLVESLIWSMKPISARDENDLGDTIGDILDAWGKGVAVLEIDWAVSKTAEYGSALVPRATRFVYPRCYGYNPAGAELMLRTSEPGVNLPGDHFQYAPFPENKFLVGIAKQKSGSPIGGALLRPLAWWWCASNFGAEWLLNYAQLFGMPIRWGTYDQNQPGLLTQLCEMLENLGSAGWAAFPEGTKLELKEAAKAGSDNPQAFILSLADKTADILILGQTLTTDHGSSGSRALGQVHQAVKSGIIDSAAEFVAKVLNTQLIPSICRLNFGDDQECPYLVPAQDARIDAKALAERDQIIHNMGVPLAKLDFYERHDLRMPDEGEDVIEGQTAPAPNTIPFPAKTKIAARDASGGTVGTPLPTSATEKLIQNILENLTGVSHIWLGGVKPYFRELLAVAEDPSVTDERFETILAKAADQIPELFDKLDHDALAKALENAMGAAAVNGAVEGFLSRRIPARARPMAAIGGGTSS